MHYNYGYLDGYCSGPPIEGSSFIMGYQDKEANAGKALITKIMSGLGKAKGVVDKARPAISNRNIALNYTIPSAIGTGAGVSSYIAAEPEDKGLMRHVFRGIGAGTTFSPKYWNAVAGPNSLFSRLDRTVGFAVGAGTSAAAMAAPKLSREGRIRLEQIGRTLNSVENIAREAEQTVGDAGGMTTAIRAHLPLMSAQAKAVGETMEKLYSDPPKFDINIDTPDNKKALSALLEGVTDKIERSLSNVKDNPPTIDVNMNTSRNARAIADVVDQVGNRFDAAVSNAGDGAASWLDSTVADLRNDPPKVGIDIKTENLGQFMKPETQKSLKIALGVTAGSAGIYGLYKAYSALKARREAKELEEQTKTQEAQDGPQIPSRS